MAARRRVARIGVEAFFKPVGEAAESDKRMGSGRLTQKAVKRVGEAGENHWRHLRQKIWRLDSCNLSGALASEQR